MFCANPHCNGVARFRMFKVLQKWSKNIFGGKFVTLNSLFAVGKTSCFPVVCSYFKGVYSLRSLMKKRCVMFLLCNCFPAPLNNCHGSTRVAHDLTERKLQEPTQTSSLLIFHMFPVELIQLDTIGKSEREHRRNL